MRLATVVLLALLFGGVGPALAQGASTSVGFVVLSGPVVLPASGSVSYNSMGVHYEAAAADCMQVGVTLTGSTNAIDPTTGCAVAAGYINLTDNSGSNTLLAGTGMRFDLENAGTSLWKTETFDLTALLRGLGCLKANGCAPSSVLLTEGDSSLTSVDYHNSKGGLVTAFVLTGAPITMTTLAGILAAGNGAILP